MLFNSCCCDPKCLILSDDFNRPNSGNIGGDLAEESGTIAIATNRLQIGTGSGLVRTTHEHDSTRMVVQATLFPPTSTGTERMRVLVNYKDTSNYLYVQIDFINTGVGVPDQADMRFFRRSGAVDTQLGATRTLDTNGLTSAVLRVCYDGTYLTAMGHREAATEIVSGFRAGLAYSGTLTANFDDFRWYRYAPECPNCIVTLECIWQFCTSASNAPSAFIALDFGAGGWTNNSCNRCTQLSGEFITEFTINCRWEYRASWCRISWSVPDLYYYLLITLGKTFVNATTIRWSADVYITTLFSTSFGGPNEYSFARYEGDVTPIDCKLSPVTLTKITEDHHAPYPFSSGACAGTLPATIDLRQLT